MAQGILQLYGASDLCVGVLSGAWVGYDDITEDSPDGLATGYIPKATVILRFPACAFSKQSLSRAETHVSLHVNFPRCCPISTNNRTYR
jgi:hypothetical protein